MIRGTSHREDYWRRGSIPRLPILRKQNKFLERSSHMPTSDNGLKLVNSFIEETGIEKMSLAAKYGVAKNVMIDILSGRLQSPKAHQVILKIIDDFKLR